MKLNRAVIPALWPGLWKEQDIALALMIALLVVMVHILVEHMPQGVFSEYVPRHIFAVELNRSPTRW
jgi:hypothetical protein